jgi:hypothetical protein
LIKNILSLNSKRKVLEYLDDFSKKKLLLYGKMRNFDLEDKSKNNVSYLSPLVARGIITEQEIVKRVLKRHKFKDIEKFIYEVYWRSYWRGFLESHPKIYSDYKIDLKNLVEHTNLENYASAINGKTGIECFDFWVQELSLSGYLHNHVRMWFASIWIFTLKIPWQLGADFFIRNLLDADFASNTLSWRWVAGLHTKGKHYIAFPENIKKYTHNNFYPVDELNINPASISKKDDYDIEPFKFNELKSTEKLSCLFIHENDLSFDIKSNFDFIIIQGSIHPNNNRSDVVNDYVSSCLNKTLSNAKKKYSDKVFSFDWNNSKELNLFLDKNNIQKISSSYPLISDLQRQIDRFFKAIDTKLVYYNNDWDISVWPHCTKGFFKLKKEIPSLISNFSNPILEL